MDADAHERIARLEQQVDWLFQRAGYEPPNGTIAPTTQSSWPYPVSPRVLELVRAGKHIQAIKEARAETGLGLAEAKALCDRARGMLDAGR